MNYSTDSHVYYSHDSDEQSLDSGRRDVMGGSGGGSADDSGNLFSMNSSEYLSRMGSSDGSSAGPRAGSDTRDVENMRNHTFYSSGEFLSPDYSAPEQRSNPEGSYSYRDLPAGQGGNVGSSAHGLGSYNVPSASSEQDYGASLHRSGSGQQQSNQTNYRFLPGSAEYYPESSGSSSENFGLGASRSNFSGSHTSGVTGSHVDMSAYRRGLGMGGSGGGSGEFDEYGKRSSPPLDVHDEAGRNGRAHGGSAGRHYDVPDIGGMSTLGMPSYGSSSDEWAQGKPGGVHMNVGGGRMTDYTSHSQSHHHQQPHHQSHHQHHQSQHHQSQYQHQHQQYDQGQSSAWNYHRQGGQGPQQHIQQVHQRSGASSKYANYDGPSQQHVLSRYMDSGRRGGDPGGHGGAARYMPRQGPAHGRMGGGRGMGGRGEGIMGSRHGMPQTSPPQSHYQQNKYYDHSRDGHQYPYGGYPAGPAHTRMYDDDTRGYGNPAGHKMRGTGPMPSVNGRSGMKTSTRSGDIVRDVELEEVIYRNTQIILSETANKRLKSVELANALRDRIGKDYLARTKTLYGGLLVLLELHRETFRVQRVPKNDMVELLIPYRGGDATTSSGATASAGGVGGSGSKIDDSCLSPTQPIQLVPEAMGLDSADIEKQQQARQMPGMGHWDVSPVSATSLTNASSGSISSKTAAVKVSPDSKDTIQTIQPSMCLYIREIPDDTTAAQIFADFGGNSIVQKVHINMEDGKRTGLIWFLSVSGALRALSIPLSSWRPFLSFHYPSDEHTFEFVEEANAASVARLCEQMISMSLMPVNDCPPSPVKYGSNVTPPNSGGIAISPSFRQTQSPAMRLAQGVDVDKYNIFREHPDVSSGPANLTSPNDDSNMLMWGDNQMKISGMTSEKPPVMRGSTPASSYVASLNRTSEPDEDQVDELGELPQGSPVLTPRGSSLSERRLAPPPINTAFASDEQLLASRSPSSAISYQLTNSPNAACLSSPGTSEAFFAFQDDSAPGGLSIISKDNLPTDMIAVMNTLCDVVYVPQKIWECNEAGDYPFVQVIVDILSVIFQNAFVQLTKLKQQVKKRLGGSIRIGPLKALLQAYPEHFEMDKNMTLVRSLKRDLPLMNIKDVNLKK